MTELSYSPVTSKEVADFSKKDPANVTDYVLSGWPNKVQEQFKPYLYRKNELSVESDCLIWGNRVIIPFHLRNKVLTELLENHPGIVRMKALACSYVWWAGMDIEIENTVKSCNACQINHTMPAKAPAHPWEKTTSPWVRLHIDFAGPFLDKMFFIIYDLFLKWINVIPMKNIKATSVISCLRNVFSTHGIPYFLVSDNEPSFSSQEFNEFCKVNRIKHLKIAPYHPSSNGAAEHSVQTFKTELKKIISDLDSVTCQ